MSATKCSKTPSEIGVPIRSSKSEPCSSSTIKDSSTPSTRSSQHHVLASEISLLIKPQDLRISSFPNLLRYDGSQSDLIKTGVPLDYNTLKSLNPNVRSKDVLYIHLQGAQLTKIEKHALRPFKNVVGIDAGENNLQIELFRVCLKLEELLLPLNNITQISVKTTDFEALKVLDLSCNSLTSSAIYSLGHLVNLRMLDLSSNNLKHLPMGLSKGSFISLETLILDHNLISHPTTFRTLARLQKLQILSLQFNQIWRVPFIETKGSEKTILKKMTEMGLVEMLPTRLFSGKPEPARRIKESRSVQIEILNKGSVFIQSEEKRTAVSESSPSIIRPTTKSASSKKILLQTKKEFAKTMAIYLKDETNEYQPFPQLRQLSLKNNKIRYASGVYAVITWSQMTELILTGNGANSAPLKDLGYIRDLLTPAVNIPYVHYNCRVIDPQLDPFHNTGLIKRFLSNDIRDSDYCYCHENLRSKRKDYSHTHNFNRDVTTATPSGMQCLPMPTQKLCRFRNTKSAGFEAKRPRTTTRSRTSKSSQMTNLTDLYDDFLSCAAPSTLPSTIQATKVALHRIFHQPIIQIIKREASEDLTEVRSTDSTKEEVEELGFNTLFRSELLTKLKQRKNPNIPTKNH